MPDLRIAADDVALAHLAAESVVESAAAAIRERGRFTIALCGGGTPRPAYELLASPAFASRIDWPSVHVFWGDERCVPPSDPMSNFRMADEALLQRVPIPRPNVHRMLGEDDPSVAAASYELLLRQFFPPGPSDTSEESFDLVLLGLGTNGHTASLFPGRPVLHERRHWTAPDFVEEIAAWRITLTVPILNAARAVSFLVFGIEKADVLRRVLQGPSQPDDLPAQLIQPHGQFTWLVDAAAASLLATSS